MPKKRQATDQSAIAALTAHAERLESLATITGGVAHDFINILTAINGEVVYLLDHVERDEMRDSLRQIRAQVQRAGRLTQRLLAVNSQGEPNRKPLDVRTAVADTVTSIARELPGEITLREIHGEEGVFALVDRAQLYHVLCQLLRNAAEAMPQGGQIEVRTDCVTVSDEEMARLGVTANRLTRVSVGDQGHGMKADVLQRATEPFFTTRGSTEGADGRGLGLSIARTIIAKHGGAIVIESEPNQGAVVSVLIPAAERPGISGKADADSFRGDERVLFVDDESPVRRAGKRVLEQFGYEVCVASSVDEAVEILERDGKAIDIIVSDIVMPQKTGHDLVDVVAKRWPGLPVIASSGYNMLMNADRDGFAASLVKPYEPLELVAEVRMILDVAGRRTPSDDEG